MANVVCLMTVKERSATFTWSEGPAAFETYTLEGMDYEGKNGFKQLAETARGMLANLIKDYLYAEDRVHESTFELAKAGYKLHEKLFPDDDQKAAQVRKWLEKLAQEDAVETIEIVVDSPWSLPWNVIYDQKPAKDDFLGDNPKPDRWSPFWGLKYNMCGGRKVDPLRRMPILRDPHVLFVVDPKIRDGLPEDQRQDLAEFINTHDLQVVHTRDDLEKAIEDRRPDLLYWLSHASPESLTLSGEDISPSDLRELLKRKADDTIRFAGLAFLNACQTAEVAGEEGSFFEAFHKAGFAGMIGTEHQTIDTFANPLGLDFLKAVLDEGKSVGSTLWRLRQKSAPLGLLYGTYCPPDIRVERGEKDKGVTISQLPRMAGVSLGVAAAPKRSVTPSPPQQLPPLPPEPYPSLAYYERKDRALFAGRDDDIERFATMLDDAATRILVLHGESGVGKSSFLHAGVIPYLEEECLGYRFIRDRQADEAAGAQGSVIFVRATNDLFGQLAQALCQFCARPYEYQTPLGETVSADLPGVLREFVGETANQAAVRGMLQADPAALGQLLAAIGNCLPFTVILVIDQGEEVFTLAQSLEDQQRGRQALDMLRQTAGAGGDFKVILALRTEYYGRVIDRLRRGLHDAGSIREYLLTDFDEDELIEAIRRPTAAEPIPYASEVPFTKYGFRYDSGVAEEIARRVTRYTTQRRDGVLPLMQVICTQLYRLTRLRPDKSITLADLESIGGLEGGMRNHVEVLLKQLLQDRPQDRRPVQRLFTRLYNKQSDGSLTTALLAEDKLREHWTGDTRFDELLRLSQDIHLLKVNTLRIGMEEERRYVSLGHDALAKIASDWDEQLSRVARMRKMASVIGAVSAVAILMTVVALWASHLKQEAVKAEQLAQQERGKAQQMAAQLAYLFLAPVYGAGDIAAATSPDEQRSAFNAWKAGYYNQNGVRITSNDIEDAVNLMEKLTKAPNDSQNADVPTVNEKLRNDDFQNSDIHAATLHLAQTLTFAFISSLGSADKKISREQAITLQIEGFVKPLCARAIKVTQDIAIASGESRKKMLTHRAEFERLFWAELYVVECLEANAIGESSLESAMMSFREQGLNNWSLDFTIDQEGLRRLANKVRQACQDAINAIRSQPSSSPERS